MNCGWGMFAQYFGTDQICGSDFILKMIDSTVSVIVLLEMFVLSILLTWFLISSGWNLLQWVSYNDEGDNGQNCDFSSWCKKEGSYNRSFSCFLSFMRECSVWYCSMLSSGIKSKHSEKGRRFCVIGMMRLMLTFQTNHWIRHF